MIDPPKDLSARGPGRKLWRDILADYELSTDELAILAAASRTLDELAALEAALSEGEIWVPGSTGQMRPNPLYSEIRQHRALLSRLLQALRVDAGESSKSDTGRKLAMMRHYRGSFNEAS